MKGGAEQNEMEKQKVPIWEKYALTVEEAAAYFGIGANKIRKLSDAKDCKFVFWVGSKRMIKRQAFEAYLSTIFSV